MSAETIGTAIEAIPQVSVVVPAYREAARIAESVRELLAYFEARGVTAEIVVADDGSDDETAAEAAALAAADARVRLVQLDRHRGKGAAMRAGMLASKGDAVLLIDADLAIPPSEYPAFAAALADADVALASKELGRRKGYVKQPLLRVLMGRIFNLVVRALILPGFLDTQAGFKLIRGAAARELAAEGKIDGFAYDVEMLALARGRRLKVVELPVHCRLTGTSSVRVFRDSVRMLEDIMAVRARMRAKRRKESAGA